MDFEYEHEADLHLVSARDDKQDFSSNLLRKAWIFHVT